MKLEKAIEILAAFRGKGGIATHGDYIEAQKLSFEAMKRFRKHSPYPHEYLGGPLPGETKD